VNRIELVNYCLDILSSKKMIKDKYIPLVQTEKFRQELYRRLAEYILKEVVSK